MKKIFILVLCLLVCVALSCQKQATVDDVVLMITDASGGAAQLEAITDQVSTWDFTMHEMPPPPEGGEMPEMKMPEGAEMTMPMTMPMIVKAKRPNKLRMDFKGPDGKITMTSCYDGTNGWSMEWGQRKDLSEAELQDQEKLATTWLDGFINYKEKGWTLELLPNETLDEQEFMVMQGTDKFGNVSKFHINPTTHYIEKESGDMLNFEGKKEPMFMIMKDYKMVDGIAIAQYVAQHKENGDLIWEATLKEVKHNTGVDDAVFMAEVMSEK